MRDVPHAPGYTLTADAYIEPGAPIGFYTSRHPSNIFEHFHDFYELAVVLQGSGVQITSAGQQPISRGTVVFVAPGVSHGFGMCDDVVMHNCFIRIETAEFDMPWAARDDRLGRLFRPARVANRPPLVTTLGDDDLESCLAHLDAIRDCAPGDRSLAHDLGHLLLALDVFASRFGQDATDHPVVDPRAPDLISSVVELLDEDLRRHWTIAELADTLCVGPHHLVRTFSRWVGMPPVAYANRRRAERAAVLLMTTDDPVAVIGSEVGWADASHFSRRFRHEFRISPRAYREQGREHQAHLHPRDRETSGAPLVGAGS